MLSEAKHLKHTVRLHSVLDFEILRFAQDDIHRQNFFPSYFYLSNSYITKKKDTEISLSVSLFMRDDLSASQQVCHSDY